MVRLVPAISSDAGFTRRTGDPGNEPIPLNSWFPGRFVCRHTRPCGIGQGMERRDARRPPPDSRLIARAILLVSWHPRFSSFHDTSLTTNARIFARCSRVSALRYTVSAYHLPRESIKFPGTNIQVFAIGVFERRVSIDTRKLRRL